MRREEMAVDAALAALEPRPLWHYFLELCRIPRPSRQEGEAATWVALQARALGCEVMQDSVGNVLARKGAAPGREGAPVVALQAHVDMVCEKAPGVVHDFARDPIRPFLEGDRLRARGTTLGADNGIGVAAALAVLATPGLRHGPLEVLVTVDEEAGLTGAANLRPGLLKARYLLNLDTEEEGTLTIGCAGGQDTVAMRRVRLVAPTEGKAAYRLTVGGLRGGHSGMEIGQGRGNALHMLARVLWSLGPAFELEVASLMGGAKRNAIPREASAVVFLPPAREAELRGRLEGLEAGFRASLGLFDPGAALRLEPAPGAFQRVMRPADARGVVAFLFSLVHGVVAMSPDLQGAVQTSTNLAVVATKGDLVEVHLNHRSPVDDSRAEVADQVRALCELAGFEAEVGEGYPGWRPDPTSELVALVQGAHRDLFGRPMVPKCLHAGLECGLIGRAHPGLQMASIGPSMWEVHTPNEQVSVSSVAAFWRLLAEVLERA